MFYMIRKVILLLLLCIGVHGFASAQTEDSVHIYLPFGTDTTCPGLQLDFTAVETNDTAIGTTYGWFANNVYTGVSIDTFHTTALADGDSVYCYIYFTNSLGLPDTAKSNTIIIYRSTMIVPHVINSIIAGSNPDCPGHPITFSAYPINGGSAPLYYWYIDGMPVLGATSSTYTSIFSDGDTVSCLMVSNSTCAFPTDTAYSNGIEIIHDSLTALLSLAVLNNPICAGDTNTFTSTVTDAGLGSTIYWFVNGVLVPGAIGPVYTTDTLHNTDIVYSMLVAPDDCVINDTTISTPITMTVIPNIDPSASIILTHGANPGCIDSAITFTATYANGGTAPDLLWLINDTVVAAGPSTYTHAYANGDLLTFRVRTTDGGCYVNDSVTTPSVLMVRDSTPVAPLISLLDNLLVANTAGTYIWFFNGTIIPGANAQTYHPAMMGFYTAIRDTGNCQSLPSNTIYISLLDVKNIAAGHVNIYPNPTTGILTFDWSSSKITGVMTIYNVVGQTMKEEPIVNTSRKNVDLSDLPAGNYIVSIRQDDGSVSTHKVLLER
jgi:hypothetical protein